MTRSLNVSAPGFSRDVQIETGETAGAALARAAQEAGARAPEKPKFIVNGEEIQADTVIPDAAVRLTVASNAPNGS